MIRYHKQTSKTVSKAAISRSSIQIRMHISIRMRKISMRTPYSTIVLLQGYDDFVANYGFDINENIIALLTQNNNKIILTILGCTYIWLY